MTDINKKPLERIAERLERVGDELRVRVHLAGLEAKDAWDRAHLERITDELGKIGSEARVQMHLASMDAKDAWDRVEAKARALSGRFGVNADQLLRELASHVEDAGKAIRSRTEEAARPERR